MMTNQQHPITPPPELVSEWAALLEHCTDAEVFAAAAQWGADQELEACCEYIRLNWLDWQPNALRAARRPTPPSLKEEALNELYLTEDSNGAELSKTQVELIRQALEALPND